MAERTVEQRRETLLQLGLVSLVDPQHAGAQPGDVAQQGVDGGIAHNRVEFLDRGGAIRLSALLCGAQPRQHLIALRRGLGEIVEGGCRRIGLVLGERLRRLERRAGGFRARLALVTEEDENGGADHDRGGEPENHDGIIRPEPLQLVCADVFVDFAENVGHCSFLAPFRLAVSTARRQRRAFRWPFRFALH